MKIVEAYQPSSVVEAHCVQQLLEDAGITCQIAGEQLASLYGIAVGWNMPSILVSEDDVIRARELIEDQLCGRGNSQEWIISHYELQRIRNEGLLPDPSIVRKRMRPIF